MLPRKAAVGGEGAIFHSLPWHAARGRAHLVYGVHQTEAVPSGEFIDVALQMLGVQLVERVVRREDSTLINVLTC